MSNGQVWKKFKRVRRVGFVALLVLVPLMVSAVPAAAAPTGSISGRVVDANGNPLAGICVNIEGGSGTQTDGAGLYSLPELDTGGYKVGFTDCSGSPQLITQWYLGFLDSNSADKVDVTDGMDTPLADVTMAVGVAVSGTVTDSNGNPLSGISVNVNPLSPGMPSTGTQTDGNGSYTTVPMTPGAYKVQFSDWTGAAAFAPQFWNHQPSWNTASPLTLSLADGPVHAGVDAQLTAGATIEGTVTNANGDPLAGICIDANVPTPNNGFDWLNGTSTAPDGTYALKQLPAADVRIRFRDCSSGPYIEQWYDAQSDQNSSQPIVLAPGEDRTGINATLTQGVAVSGTVTDPNGNPIAGINVNVNPVDNGPNAWGQTDSDGKYTTNALSAGSYRVQFQDSGPTPAWAAEYWDDQISRNDATTLTLVPSDAPVRGSIDAVLTQAASVTGTVTDPDGAPAGGICVIAVIETSNGSDGIGFTTTAGDGTYTLGGLPASSPTILFQDCNGTGPYVDQWWDHQSSQQNATALPLAPGATRSGIDAQLAAAGQIQGRVTDEGGSPLEGICAQATTSTFVGGLARTDSDGRYSINVSRAGTYRVQFVDCNGTPKFAGQWWDHATSVATAAPVTVAPGDVATGIDASLVTGNVGAISGTVKNLNGVAMTTACVVAFLPNQFALFSPIAADGTYTIANVPSGLYSVAFLGCPPNSEPSATVQDPQSSITSYKAVWWGGNPVLLANTEGGPDPIAQGATLVNVGPGQDLQGYDWCFGCTAIEIATITPGNGSATVAYTTPLLEPAGVQSMALASAEAGPLASGFTYTATCTSSNGGVTGTASGPGSPLTVTGLTPGKTYVCRVTASDGTITVAASDDSVVVLPSSANPTDPTAKTVSFPTTIPSGGMARTGADSEGQAKAGAAIFVLGLALVLLGRSRRRNVPAGL